MNVQKPVEQVIAGIESLDLEPIKMKLMDAEEGYGWSREHAERIETAYRRFLVLSVKYPERTIAPTKDVDKFWHGHILDTMKYAQDCQAVFGYFLHHFPYLGMRGEQDAADHRAAAAEMHALYEKEFGEALPVNGGSRNPDSAFCTAAKPAFCTAAKPAAAFCTAASAFCTAAKPAAAFCTAASSFCTVAKPQAAFCTASSSFCTVAKPQAAFCTAAKAAFCTAAKQA